MRALILNLYDQLQGTIVDNAGDRAIVRIGFERAIQAVHDRCTTEHRAHPDEQEIATEYLTSITPETTQATGGGVNEPLTGPLANLIKELAAPDELETQSVTYLVHVHATAAAPPAQAATFTEAYFRNKFSYAVISSPLRALQVYNRQCANAPLLRRRQCVIL